MATANTSTGSPLTYNFEATVYSVAPINHDVGLPFSLAVDDVLSGRITIDSSLSLPPIGNSSKSDQPYPIQFEFDGYEFGTNAFATAAINNTPTTGDGSIPAGNFDTISITCSSSPSSACTPSPVVIGSSPPLNLFLGMNFYGSNSSFAIPAIPESAAAWNDFGVYRTMRITFVNQLGQSLAVNASVSDFSLVPEPWSGTLMLLAGVFLSLSQRGILQLKKEFWNIEFGKRHLTLTRSNTSMQKSQLWACAFLPSGQRLFIEARYKLMKVSTYLLGLLFLLNVLVVCSPPSFAEQLTLRFDAKVTNIDVLSPNDLPFSLNVEDVIHGRFKFTPIDVPLGTTTTNTTQHHGATLAFDSTTLETADYFMRVRDNIPMIGAPTILRDHITLGCTSTGVDSCNPNLAPNSTNIIWWFNLPLSGGETVLEGADIPGDASTWQQFAPGFLTITFQELGVSDLLRITAVVNQFTVVPEPTLSLINCAVWIVGFAFMHRRLRFTYC